MIPRSAAGRAIVKEVDTGVKETVEQSKERFIVLKKKSRDALLGVRFGVHPTTSQVIVTEIFSGYPAMESGKLFVGDVLLSVNGVRITEVDMATQIIKLADNKVELKTTNVYVDSRPRQPSFSQGGPPRTSVSNPPPPPPPPPPAPPPAAPPARPPPGASTDLGGDLLLDLDDEAAAPAPAARADVLSLAGSAGSGRGASATAAGSATTAATSLMDDLVLDDPDDFTAFASASASTASATPAANAPSGNQHPGMAAVHAAQAAAAAGAPRAMPTCQPAGAVAMGGAGAYGYPPAPAGQAYMPNYAAPHQQPPYAQQPPPYWQPGPGYAPQGPGYPPQGPGYPPQGPGYPPQGPGYSPQGPGYGHPGYPPQGPGYPPQGPGYGPPGYPPAAGYSPAAAYSPMAAAGAPPQPRTSFSSPPHGMAAAPGTPASGGHAGGPVQADPFATLPQYRPAQ